jgi:predicted AAA+ superfamily ATPase
MIKRDYYLNRLIHNMWNGEIKVITGIRRCGKSVLCTSQQKLDTNFKYYLSINLISVQYGASFATFLSG